MRTLNLVDLDKSDIKYLHQKFPDGQQNVNFEGMQVGLIKGYTNPKFITPIEIKSRLNNWLDLELITCAVASLRELDVTEIHLHVPYIIGARSDRKFEEGGNNYVKHVIAPAINNLKFRSVTCIDPHSDVLEACINRFRKESNINLIKFSLNNIYNLICGETAYLKQNNFILVSPDAGASKKIYKLAEQIGYKGDIITCSKDRDKDGKLTKTIVPITDSIIKSKKDYIIIDDICDGGATFINIAKEIKATFSIYGKTEKPKIYLIVTHGIFSKGFGELQQYFDGIYTTNSYKQLNPDTQDFIKQLNVF